jgi:hypothetical protein
MMVKTLIAPLLAEAGVEALGEDARPAPPPAEEPVRMEVTAAVPDVRSLRKPTQ